MSESAGTSAPAAAPAAAPASEAPKGAADAAPVSAAATGEATPAAPKTFTVKVDGKPVQVTEEELLRGYTLQATGQKRLQEVAKEKKAVESEKAKVSALISAAKSGDYEALQQAGLSESEIEGLSIKFLSAKQQKMLEAERVKSLDPRDAELEQFRRDKAEREAQAKKAQEAKKETEVNSIKQKFTNHVIGTLDQFPEQYRRNDALAQTVVDAWTYCYENEIATTPEKVAVEVAKEFKGLYKLMVTHAKDEELDDLAPAELRERLMKIATTKAGATAHPSLTGTPQVREPADKKEEKKGRKLSQAQVMRRAYFPK